MQIPSPCLYRKGNYRNNDFENGEFEAVVAVERIEHEKDHSHHAKLHLKIEVTLKLKEFVDLISSNKAEFIIFLNAPGGLHAEHHELDFRRAVFEYDKFYSEDTLSINLDNFYEDINCSIFLVANDDGMYLYNDEELGKSITIEYVKDQILAAFEGINIHIQNEENDKKIDSIFYLDKIDEDASLDTRGCYTDISANCIVVFAGKELYPSFKELCSNKSCNIEVRLAFLPILTDVLNRIASRYDSLDDASEELGGLFWFNVLRNQISNEDLNNLFVEKNNAFEIAEKLLDYPLHAYTSMTEKES